MFLSKISKKVLNLLVDALGLVIEMSMRCVEWLAGSSSDYLCIYNVFLIDKDGDTKNVNIGATGKFDLNQRIKEWYPGYEIETYIKI